MDNKKNASNEDDSEYAESNTKTIIIVGIVVIMVASIMFAFLRM